MNKFATRLFLTTSLLVLGIVLLLGGILLTSSVSMLRGHAMHTARAVTQLIATEFEQKRDMRDRILQNLHPARPDPPQDAADPRHLILNAPPVFPPEQREQAKNALQEDLSELAEIIQASQIAIILTEDMVVAANADPTDEFVLSETEILSIAQEHTLLPNQLKELRYHRSIVIFTRLESMFMGQNTGLLVQLPMATFARAFRVNAVQLSLVILVIAIAAVLCVIWLSRSISKPLSGLTQVVASYSQGQLEQEAPVAGPSETQLLGKAFNDMAQSLEKHIEALQQETRRREQLETEFRIAAQLQHSLLPEPGLYQSAKLQLLGWNEQAKEVGGDFYDYWTLEDGRIAVVIGDAAGKGITAALLAARCLSVLQTLTEQCGDPAEILRQANNALCRQFKLDGHFVTGILAIIDPHTEQLYCALAGHNPAFFMTKAQDTPIRLTSKIGLPLGIAENTAFETLRYDFHAESTLLLYTDGVTEAFDPEKTLYGETRLEQVFCQHTDAGLETLLQRHQDDLARHRQERSPNDDATIVLLRLCG